MIIPIKPWLDMDETVSNLGNFARSGENRRGLILSSTPELDELQWARPVTVPTFSHLTTTERMKFYHEPIMGAEILEAMRPVEGKQIFDGTLGGGGHSEMLLENGAHIVGCDQDSNALAHASERLAKFGDRFLPVRGNFESILDLLRDHGIEHVDGVVLDLGVSSKQLDDPARGFSFREDGPLDMRMDDRQEFTAKTLVNEWSEEEMIRIFRSYGEEKRAVRAAKEISKARAEAPIETTLQLAEIVSRAIPKVDRKHPATKVFQAIRIAVNRELEVLENALEAAVDALAPGGVLAVISFHSLEDRIVKQFMRRRSDKYIDRPEWPAPKDNPDFALTLPSRRAITPDEEEVERNPRSRSAKLRIAVKA